MRTHLRAGRRRAGMLLTVALVATLLPAGVVLTAGSASAADPATVGYVVTGGSNSVTPIDAAGDTAGTPIIVGAAPTGVAVSPDGSIAYVTDQLSNTVTPITIATDTPGTAIAVGAQPTAVAFTPDGTKAYVTNYSDDTVTPIIVATNTPGTPITVGAQPTAVAFSADGTKAYVANYGDDTVTPIIVATNTAGTPITVGAQPTAVAFTPGGTTAYVTNYSDNTVTPITVATNTPGAPITVGTQPTAVAFTPDGTTAYVTNYSDNTVTPITVATNTPGTAIAVGLNPRGVAFSPDGTKAYVANYGDNTVTPIIVATNTAGTVIAVGSQPSTIAFASGAPRVSFTATPGTPPLETTPVAFDASSSSIIVGTIVDYRWDFGDATVVNAAIPTTAHTYTTAGTHTVTLTATGANGGFATTTRTVTVYEVPSITTLSPATGAPAGGQIVTITGTGFIDVTAVSFGATPATSFTSVDATTITAVAPAHAAGEVDVTVTTPGGTSAVVAGDEFTYVEVPAITSVAPTSGPAAGGTVVTITGTAFTGATVVKFGANDATGVSVVNDTTITATAPTGTLGTVDVTVTTPGGTSAMVAGDEFTYAAVPAITLLSPAAGPPAGGNAVTITGSGFADASAVLFGANNATTFTVDDATTITATAPAGTLGTVDVTVTTPGGTSAVIAAGLYTYANVPAVFSLAPSSGPLVGGTSVTITGTGFTGATAVNFGATAATFAVIDATTITATAPAGTLGTVDITVTTPSGTSAVVAGDEFTYVAIPVISSLAPTSGPPAGGTVVTVTGSGFADASAVLFGANNATTYTVVDATTITATAPAGTLGTVDVTVTTPGGTSAVVAGDVFTYVALPVISSLAPPAGSILGGASVTITGSGFDGATAVSFGATNAPTFTVVDATTITVTSPAASAGAVHVRVTTAGGTSTTSTASGFYYFGPPVVASVSPAAGPLSGGNSVLITGSSFSNATAVYFGGTPSSSFTVNSSTSISAIAPPGAAGTVDVIVFNSLSQPSAVSANDRYVYTALPVITSVGPTEGPTLGGNTVTITGTGLTGVSAIRFGANAATSVNCSSSTSCTVVAPAGLGTVQTTATTAGGTSVSSVGAQYTYFDVGSTEPLVPARLLDSRQGASTIDGTAAGGGTRGAGTTTVLQVAGRGGVPLDAKAVALNVTVTGTTGVGYVTVYPCGTARPNASNLNHRENMTIANTVITKIGSNGTVCLYNSGETQLIVDANAYFYDGDLFTSLNPARVLDSRPSSATVDGTSAGIGLRSAGSVTEVQITGRGGVAGNASAVALNVTVTEAESAGYVTVFPCGSAQPNTSNVNFDAGTSIPNAVIVKVGAGGKICVFTSARTQLIVDVNASFRDTASSSSVVPARLLDSRPNAATIDGVSAGIGLRAAGSVTQLHVTGRGGVPSDATTVMVNLTATGTQGEGYVTVFPCGTERPNASSLNYAAGSTIAALVIAKVGAGGNICLYTSAPTHLLVDVDAYVS